jgi:hypothetical protein
MDRQYYPLYFVRSTHLYNMISQHIHEVFFASIYGLQAAPYDPLDLIMMGGKEGDQYASLQNSITYC